MEAVLLLVAHHPVKVVVVVAVTATATVAVEVVALANVRAVVFTHHTMDVTGLAMEVARALVDPNVMVIVIIPIFRDGSRQNKR